MAVRLTDAEFSQAWRQGCGSPAAVADLTGMNVRAVYNRRAAMAARGTVLHTEAINKAGSNRLWTRPSRTNPNRLDAEIGDGPVIIFSDAHYWPGEPSIAHRALLSLIGDIKPVAIIANGDILDGARISRHDRLGWQHAPTLKLELDAAQLRMGEVEDAAPPGCQLIRTIGNHCARFDRYLAMNAPEMEGLPGSTLREHFPKWEDAYSVWINGRSAHPVMVKHRLANGIHAGYNNTLRAGTSIITGHLHRLLVTPWGDYRGRRWGVDTGTLADPDGPQFAYAEDNPAPHCAGFAVTHFEDQRLLPPELCEVLDGVPYFRGARVAI